MRQHDEMNFLRLPSLRLCLTCSSFRIRICTDTLWRVLGDTMGSRIARALSSSVVPFLPARQLGRVPEAGGVFDLEGDGLGEHAPGLRGVMPVAGAFFTSTRALLEIADLARLGYLSLAPTKTASAGAGFDVDGYAIQTQALLIPCNHDFVADSGARGEYDLARNLYNP